MRVHTRRPRLSVHIRTVPEVVGPRCPYQTHPTLSLSALPDFQIDYVRRASPQRPWKKEAHTRDISSWWVCTQLTCRQRQRSLSSDAYRRTSCVSRRLSFRRAPTDPWTLAGPTYRGKCAETRRRARRPLSCPFGCVRPPAFFQNPAFD